MDFLRQYSHTPYFQRSCFHSSHGVTVEKMIFKLDEWLAREVDIPPLPEQRKIAAILSAVDEVIERTAAVIESLQTLKKAMLQELLTRGLPGRHSRFKQTEIGEIPEEWAAARIGEWVSFPGGSQPPKSEFVADERPGYVRLIQIRDYKTDRYQTYVREESVRKFCAPDDVMIGRYGPPIFQILRGIAARMPTANATWIVIDRIAFPPQ